MCYIRINLAQSYENFITHTPPRHMFKNIILNSNPGDHELNRGRRGRDLCVVKISLSSKESQVQRAS